MSSTNSISLLQECFAWFATCAFCLIKSIILLYFVDCCYLGLLGQFELIYFQMTILFHLGSFLLNKFNLSFLIIFFTSPLCSLVRFGPVWFWCCFLRLIYMFNTFTSYRLHYLKLQKWWSKFVNWNTVSHLCKNNPWYWMAFSEIRL